MPALCRDCLSDAIDGAARCHACGSPRLARHVELNALSIAHVDELKQNQVRIANEQARYEIAIRADLAALAEQFRRPR